MRERQGLKHISFSSGDQTEEDKAEDVNFTW